MNGGRPLRHWRLALIAACVVAGGFVLERSVTFPAAAVVNEWTPRTDLAIAKAPKRDVDTGRPVFSLVLDEADLHDPKRGLLANVMEHGPDWERPGSIAFFDRGRLQFSSGVGVRIHGGSSREMSPRQGFRLYFRRKYGARQVPPGLLFEPDAQPIRRLIVHNDVRAEWHFANPLAYDLAEAVGAIAPDTYPVRFYVNGEYYGVFVLTERFSEQFFAAHRGNDEVRIDQNDFDALWAWVQKTRPLSLPVVSQKADVDNLARWFLAVAFAGTRDAYQGPGQFLDLSGRQPPWFWINWDMDQSFRDWDVDMYQYLLNRVDERRRGRNPAEPRSTMLTSLFAEDQAFITQYKRLVTAALNHHLTPKFLRERFEYYRQTTIRHRLENFDFLRHVRDFLDKRPAFFRTITEQWLNTGKSQPMVLAVPDGESILIDGESAIGGFEGLYFPDLEVELRAPGNGGGTFVEWRVDGRSAGQSDTLRLTITKPTHVEAVFRGKTGRGPRFVPNMVEAPAAPFINPRSTPLRWSRVPAPATGASSFLMTTTEITVGAYAAYAAPVGLRLPTQPGWFANEFHPVMNVTWDEAQAFCRAHGGRLPTDMEWTFASRGGASADQPFPWGTTFAGEANLGGLRNRDKWVFTAPVGSFAPNGYGLYDMIGNLWEWTEEVYDDRGVVADPRASHETARPGYDVRAVHGGSWDTDPQRFPRHTGLSRQGRHNMYVGFRCAK